jgi:hypothetical protein
MSALDTKQYGTEAEDQSNSDQGVAMGATVKDDGRPSGSTEYDGPKLPYEQEVNGNVSGAQLSNVGRK